MTTLFSDGGKVLGALRPAPLTIINPKAFDSFYDINNKILLDNAKSIVGGTINTALDVLQSTSNNSLVNPINKLLLQGLSNELIKSIFEVNNLNEDSLDYFRFRINPNRLSKRRKKITTQKYTGNGWDVDTRGEEMIVYSYSGNSGSLVAVEVYQKLMSILNGYLKKSGIFDSFLGNIVDYFIYNPKLSSAYIKMVMFDKFWKSNNDDLLIVWEDNTYLGKFQSFEWNQDAMNPYLINYNFDFVVYPQFNYNTNTGWIEIDDDKRIRRRFKSIITTPIKNSSITLTPKKYTADYTITENDIIFDVVYSNIVQEVERRVNMAKFYNAKRIGASEVIKNKEYSLEELLMDEKYIDIKNFIDNSLLVKDLVWFDGEIVNCKIALPSLSQRISDKLVINTSLAGEAVYKGVSYDRMESAMNKNTNVLNANLYGSQLENIDNITPQELATKYTKLSGIDIFEDSISFNLKKDNDVSSSGSQPTSTNSVGVGSSFNQKMKF